MKPFAIPLTIIVVGVAWLLTAQGFLPSVSWAWTLGLALAGIFTFVYLGFNKLTFVVGPFLLVSSVFSLIRQTGGMTVNTEVPVLVIILGLLMVAAQMLPVPKPSWLIEEDPAREENDR